VYTNRFGRVWGTGTRKRDKLFVDGIISSFISFAQISCLHSFIYIKFYLCLLLLLLLLLLQKKGEVELRAKAFVDAVTKLTVQILLS